MDKIKQWLAEHNVKHVQCLISDHTGIARGKVFPVNKFIEDGGCRLAETILLQGATGDLAESKYLYTLADERDIDMILKPDVNACYMLPWADEPTAMIIHDCVDHQESDIELSPRNLLKKVVALYANKGWKAVVAPEMELYLTQTTTDSNMALQAPVGKSGREEIGRQSFGIDALSEFEPLLKDIYQWAAEQGLELDIVVHEEGRAQFEFNFNHGDPVNLADQVVVFKRTVKAAAEKHGITATFMAKPMSDQPGSAMHIHQSIVDIATGKNIFSDATGVTKNGPSGFSEAFYHYLGGLQKYTAQVMPMFAPNVNSYRRFLVDQATPTNLHWGIENRTVGLRIPDAPAIAKRVENRLPGADANPYLAIAATLICGYIGMMEKTQPSAETTHKANKERNDHIPRNIEASIALMKNSETIRQYLGETFVDGFLATRQAEYNNFKSVVTSWERHYLLTIV
jgi:glutamine synthetase